ncbi:hypothetical protein JCM10213_006602 [Rhodosporidiobolus nylandii]
MAYDDAGASRGRGRGRGRGGGGRGGASSRGGAGAGQGARGGSRASQGEPGSIPSGSVSKLKAQLRQTKRLLARDDLTPDVRTTSERRLASLEQEIVKAERGNLEKKMVSRYRGVKFFERQKLLRKIKQAKKQLSEAPEDEKLKTQLLEARIDLYYVLRFPKTAKYVALFPDGSYVPHSSSSSLAPSDPSAAPTAAETTRTTLRASIRKQLEEGALPEAPEEGELGIEGEEDVGAAAPEKRGREDSAEKEVRQPAGKKRKVQPEPVVEEEEVAEEVEEEQEVAGEEQPKKKENRKQRKERKRAEQAAAAAGGVDEGATPVKKEAPAKKGKKGAEEKKGLAEEDDFFA